MLQQTNLISEHKIFVIEFQYSIPLSLLLPIIIIAWNIVGSTKRLKNSAQDWMPSKSLFRAAMACDKSFISQWWYICKSSAHKW